MTRIAKHGMPAVPLHHWVLVARSHAEVAEAVTDAVYERWTGYRQRTFPTKHSTSAVMNGKGPAAHRRPAGGPPPCPAPCPVLHSGSARSVP